MYKTKNERVNELASSVVKKRGRPRRSIVEKESPEIAEFVRNHMAKNRIESDKEKKSSIIKEREDEESVEESPTTKSSSLDNDNVITTQEYQNQESINQLDERLKKIENLSDVLETKLKQLIDPFIESFEKRISGLARRVAMHEDIFGDQMVIIKKNLQEKIDIVNLREGLIEINRQNLKREQEKYDQLIEQIQISGMNKDVGAIEQSVFEIVGFLQSRKYQMDAIEKSFEKIQKEIHQMSIALQITIQNLPDNKRLVKERFLQQAEDNLMNQSLQNESTPEDTELV